MNRSITPPESAKKEEARGETLGFRPSTAQKRNGDRRLLAVLRLVLVRLVRLALGGLLGLAALRRRAYLGLGGLLRDLVVAKLGVFGLREHVILGQLRLGLEGTGIVDLLRVLVS